METQKFKVVKFIMFSLVVLGVLLRKALFTPRLPKICLCSLLVVCFILNLFILAVLGLRCCASSSPVVGLLSIVVHGSLTAVASPAAEHGLQDWWHAGSGAAARRL